MNGTGSSPPSLFGRTGKKDRDSHDQIHDIVAADARRESPTRTLTPTQARSDITEMPPSPPSAPGGEVGTGSANEPPEVIEPAVEREDEMEVDPKDEIQKFDWEELERQYHHMIADQTDAENQLWEEFTQLNHV